MIKNANIIIYTSLDPDGGHWEPLLPENVPDTIKDPDVLGYLMAGDICKINDSDLWYRAEKYDS